MDNYLFRYRYRSLLDAHSDFYIKSRREESEDLQEDASFWTDLMNVSTGDLETQVLAGQDAIKGFANRAYDTVSDAGAKATSAGKDALDIAVRTAKDTANAVTVPDGVKGSVSDAKDLAATTTNTASEVAGEYVDTLRSMDKTTAVAAAGSLVAAGTVGAGLAKAAKSNLNPEAFYKKYGKCPRGYRRDGEKNRCATYSGT